MLSCYGLLISTLSRKFDMGPSGCWIPNRPTRSYVHPSRIVSICHWRTRWWRLHVRSQAVQPRSVQISTPEYLNRAWLLVHFWGHIWHFLFHAVLVTLQWEPRTVKGQPPPRIGYHTTTLHDSRLIVIGGFDGRHVFDQVWCLELASSAYLPQVTNFSIPIDEM